MKDLFIEFRRYNARKHLAIGICAFAFALGVNAFLFKTDAGVRLQTSAVEFAWGTKNATQEPDLVLVKSNTGSDSVKLRLTKKIEKATEIQASLVTDPTNIILTNIESLSSSIEVSKLSNIPGVTLLIIRFSTPTTIEAGTDLIHLMLNKKRDEETPLNLASTRLIADSVSYDLTNKGVLY